MECFLTPLRELADYEEIHKKRGIGEGYIQIVGGVNSQKIHMIQDLGDGFEFKIIAFSSEEKAKGAYEEYGYIEENVYYYPPKDLLFHDVDIKSKDIFSQKINVIKSVIEQQGRSDDVIENDKIDKGCITIITTIDSFLDGLPSLDEVKQAVIKIENSQSLDFSGLQKDLVEIGYERVVQVESPGHFAVRGGIVDVYPFTRDNPVRVELWGDEVDSIREFDVESQRTVSTLEEVILYPACEVKSLQRNSFIDYFSDTECIVFLDEPTRLVETLKSVYDEYKSSMERRLKEDDDIEGKEDTDESIIEELNENINKRDGIGKNKKKKFEKKIGLEVFTPSQIVKKLNTFKGIAFTSLDTKLRDFTMKEKVNIDVKSVNSYHSSFEMLTRDLSTYKKKGYRVVLLSPSMSRAKRLAEDLRDYDLRSYYSDDIHRTVNPSEILVACGHLAKGYEYPMLKFLVISERDIFGKQLKRKKRKRYSGEKIQDFSSLKIGDYVVHENHGLGIYQGIEKIEVDRVAKDYMKIEYANNGALFILATGFDVIQKYAGVEAKRPKLNRLGGGAWSKTKTQVKGAIHEIARDLVELYAHRQNQKGYAYEGDTIWQKEFEELFPFEETEDQLEAIADTKRDMESDKIMDRLICGDVGYGKTEIAIRASFKAVQEGKQVVYLVPTTILAQQHYQTFTQRMKDYPVRIDLLSRFRTPTQVRKTLKDLKKGLVDIIIGTHRVLSADVHYKDLGLLILDEEQRFGVRHKEKIKKLKENIDVLTMTATPIPRTLHMSLIGIRDLSVLNEAPQDRMPIQTYVMEYQEEMVREAIQREVGRRGQVYYVYNRVNDIADVAGRIQRLVPEAVVSFAHGQMPERHLENIMQDFIEGEVDVLVSTTIVETGLDISNANTMIIHDADQFGLSQLYQLRGRIGRSNRMAYAFLLYRRDKLLSEVAQKRLTAIRDFTELGSGIKIAMRDLEIRGAGNLLGTVQSGHMSAVGYDLYCKMLGQAVAQFKGEKQQESFNTIVDINVDAFIPDTYIQNEVGKLEAYKRIATIETEDEMGELLDELIDRYGEIPKKAYQLLRIASLKALAKSVYVTEVSEKEWGYRFDMYERAAVNPLKIPDLLEIHGGFLEFKAETPPYFIYRMRGKRIKLADDENIEFVKNLLNDFKLLLER